MQKARFSASTGKNQSKEPICASSTAQAPTENKYSGSGNIIKKDIDRRLV
jgi:hypothetical protein